MPITEFVTPLLKHDAASIAFFQSTLFPTLSSTFASAPGFRLFALGHMIEENGISTSGAFKPVLGLSWKKDQDFYSFVTSENFKALGPQMKQIAVAPSKPQLYESDVEPDAIFSAILTEVYSIKIPNDTVAAKVKDSWRAFGSAVEKATAGKGDEAEVHLLSGTSLNMEEKTFIGMLGWKSTEAREASLKNPAVVEGRTKLLGVGDATSLLVSFKE